MHFHFENRLHRLLDFRFGRLWFHLEDQGVLVFLDGQAFFRNHRTANNLVCAFHICSANVLRLPPPLFGAGPACAARVPASSPLHPLPACAAASRPKTSAKSAASR